MKVEQLEDITIDQQQAVFGAYDTLIAIVERALMVTIGLHNSVVEIKGNLIKMWKWRPMSSAPCSASMRRGTPWMKRWFTA